MVELVKPESFYPQNHFYEKALNAQPSTAVSSFLNMNSNRIVERYFHLNPSINKEKLLSLLKYKPENFRWAGADLFNVTTEDGKRSMVLIETNSCPSGQKSMPTFNEDDKGGYEKLIQTTILPVLEENKDILPNGVLAVVYDKNKMEASGYAATLADAINEPVYLVPFKTTDKELNVTFNKEKIMQIKYNDKWVSVRAAFRYVTQKPWNRIPIDSKTLIFNPIVACLAGGRNKLVADMSYEFFNSEMSNFEGLQINVPYTIRNVKWNEIPLWIKSFGGIAVVKNPYSNAGQGVWTITSPEEFSKFSKEKQIYDEFIVQGLIGNYKWSSKTPNGKLFHVGTIPDKQGKIYVADLRMMVHYDYTKKCFRPLVMYGRKAANHLIDNLDNVTNSWNILGTNLSIKLGENQWGSDTSRLLLMDQKDFNKLGLSIDDLINGFIQTVMAVIAIDKMTKKLLINNKDFNFKLFQSINPDEELLKEILR